jgi:hypothetical protein
LRLIAPLIRYCGYYKTRILIASDCV